MSIQKVIEKLINIKNILQTERLSIDQKLALKQEYQAILLTSLSADKQINRLPLIHVVLDSLIKSMHPDESVISLFDVSDEQTKQSTMEIKEFKASHDEAIDKGLLVLSELAYLDELNGDFKEHAGKLQIMCGDLENALDYVYEFSRKNNLKKDVFHDACLFSIPPDVSTWDVLAWRKWANNNGKWKNLVENKDFVSCVLPSANSLEAVIKAKMKTDKALPELFDTSTMKPTQKSSLEKKWKELINNPNNSKYFITFLSECPIDLLMHEYNKLLFINAEQNVEAAKEFKKNGMTQENFDQYLSLKPVDSDEIPNIVISGKDIGFDNYQYYLKKLDPKDPRVPCLGKITDCCQSLGGDGAQCAIYGIESPHSGFYAICKMQGKTPKLTDPIVSQAWAWRSTTGALVLDSIESLKENAKGQVAGTSFKNIDLWKTLYRELGRRVIGPPYNIREVLVGKSGNTPKDMGLSSDHLESPIEYDGYRDSKDKQMILATSSLPLVELYYLGSGFPENPIKEQMKKSIQKYIGENPSLNEIINLIQNCTSNDLTIMHALDFFVPKSKDKEFSEYYINALQPEEDWLCEAARLGSISKIEWLESKGLNTANCIEAMLYAATRSGKLEMIRYLEKRGANLNLNYLLREAVFSRQLDVVQYIESKIENKSELDLSYNMSADNEGIEYYDSTALMIAAKSNQWDIVKFLISKNASIEGRNYKGDTILELAAKAGLLDMVKYAVENGKKWTKQDYRIAIINATEAGHLNIVKFLNESVHAEKPVSPAPEAVKSTAKQYKTSDGRIAPPPPPLPSSFAESKSLETDEQLARTLAEQDAQEIERQRMIREKIRLLDEAYLKQLEENERKEQKQDKDQMVRDEKLARDLEKQERKAAEREAAEMEERERNAIIEMLKHEEADNLVNLHMPKDPKK